MPLIPGSRLGPYEIVSPVGAGGMGEVYRARDTRLGRDVALKTLPAGLANDAEQRARFEREARAASSLNHPHICVIHDVGSDNGVDYLVMELLEGETVADCIARGPMPMADVMRLGAQVADALDRAHKKGLVHRDLKPANIMLVRPGSKSGPVLAKLLDFGLARPSPITTNDETMARSLTAAGTIVGTFQYMSPEQVEGREVDARTDIWSLGATLYEMATGARAFDGPSTASLITAVLRDEPTPLAERVPLTPPAFQRVVMQCLAKDPDDRWQSAGDVKRELDWIAGGGGSNTGMPATMAGAPPRATKNPLVLPLVVVAALVVGAVGAWVAIGSRGRPTARLPVAFVEPPPSGTRFIGAPRPSPDGQRLAWIAVDAAGTSRLWTRELNDVSPHAIDGTDGVTIAFWSPDSLQLAFVARGQVRRVASGGGPVSLIVSANPLSGVWLADGEILLALSGQGLMRVAATGGVLRPANGFTSETFRNLQIDGLDVSPDGRYLLFSQFGGETGIYVARVDGTAKRLLYPGEQSLAAFVGPDTIVREDANVLMAQRFNATDMNLSGEAFPVAQNVGASDFTGGASGALSFVAGARERSRLTWFTRDGKAAGVVGPASDYTEVTISRSGRWLGFVQRDPVDGNVDIWLQALPAGAPSRLTSDPDVDHLFTISDDDRDVAWEAHAKGTLNLMRRPVDGSSPPQLVRTWGKAGGPTGWSPDGHIVLYHSDDGTSGSNLWAVPVDGSGEPVRLTQPGFGSSDGHYSPDGRWLAFVGETTGEKEIYVQRIEGLRLVGGPIRVSDSGGEWPLWRRDGAELFFMKRDALMAAEFNSQSDRPAGVPRTLFTIASLGSGSSRYGRQYAATPDGQRFVAIVSVTDANPRPATVIFNWRASIDRQ